MPLAGEPEALLASAEQMAGVARTLDAVRGELVAHARSITAGWTGLAAPQAATRIEGDAEELRRAVDAVAGVVGPLRTYADELRTAQREFDLGEQQRSQPATVPAGLAAMTSAAERALAANEAAARVFEAALAVPATTPQTGGGAGLGAALAEGGNLAASLGSAVLHHPGSTFAVAGGGVIATLSAAGVLGGTAATATGVGSPVGVPLTAASVAGVAVGAGLAGAGAVDLTQHALGDDRVTPFRVDADAGVVAPFDPPGEISGMTRHAEERAAGRDGGTGVSGEAMADAIANPTEEPSYQSHNRTYVYRGRDAEVVLNEEGRVVTTWATSSRGWRNR
ncbi:WXG100 family type VII secretion target [Actinomycetospora sp. CA-053990]|uniref:WXG100 family type VII secretion target n=1 Tax=Actinomycetospora sp. CA-053990 TaxID=3239891 RepID=UPI003D948139